MISVADFEQNGLICDNCGQGFCEIIDQESKELN